MVIALFGIRSLLALGYLLATQVDVGNTASIKIDLVAIDDGPGIYIIVELNDD